MKGSRSNVHCVVGCIVFVIEYPPQYNDDDTAGRRIFVCVCAKVRVSVCVSKWCVCLSECVRVCQNACVCVCQSTCVCVSESGWVCVRVRVSARMR